MKKVMMDDVVFDSLRRLHLRTIRCYNANICREWHSFEVYVSILGRRYLHRRADRQIFVTCHAGY